MGGEVSTSSTPRVGDCRLNPVRDGRDSKSSDINATCPIEVAGVERSSVVTSNRTTDIGSEIGTRHLAGVMADAGKTESLAATTPHEHNEATPTLRDGAAIGNKTKADDDVNQGEEILLDETDTGNPDHAETETAGAPKSRGKRNIITAPIRQPSSGEYRLDANGKLRLVLSGTKVAGLQPASNENRQRAKNLLDHGRAVLFALVCVHYGIFVSFLYSILSAKLSNTFVPAAW